MATGQNPDEVPEQPQSPNNDGATKKNKQKKAPHACNWEAFDDPDVVVEQGWKKHDEEYWLYMTIK